MNNIQETAWNLFLKSGSVESYLKYSATKNKDGDVLSATNGKGLSNKRK